MRGTVTPLGSNSPLDPEGSLRTEGLLIHWYWATPWLHPDRDLALLACSVFALCQRSEDQDGMKLSSAPPRRSHNEAVMRLSTLRGQTELEPALCSLRGEPDCGSG